MQFKILIKNYENVIYASAIHVSDHCLGPLGILISLQLCMSSFQVTTHSRLSLEIFDFTSSILTICNSRGKAEKVFVDKILKIYRPFFCNKYST